MDVRVGADARSRRGLNQAATLLLLPLIAIFVLAMQGLFSFTAIAFLLLIKIFFLSLLPPIARFGYAVYEARRELKLKGSPYPGSLPPNPAGATGSLNTTSLPATSELPTTPSPPSVTEHTTKQLKS
jgi:hypothetical protein